MRDDRFVARQMVQTLRRQTVKSQHRNRIQSAASTRVVMQQTSQSKTSRAGSRRWTFEHLGPADTSPVIGMRKKYRRRDFQNAGLQLRLHDAVTVDDVRLPIAKDLQCAAVS